MRLASALLAVTIFAAAGTQAQGPLAAFSVWKPKEGQAALFEAGYKRHLQWHRAAGDKWSWYGWFIAGGERDGQFVDATFGHEWADLDHRVDPTGDGTDNGLHTEPFADYLKGYKLQRLSLSDKEDSSILFSKYLRMLTLDVNDPAAAATLVGSAAATLRQKGRSLLAYEKVDGGALGQIILFLGANSFADYGQTATWQDELVGHDHRSSRPVITAISSETLVFRRDMSLMTAN